MTLLSKGHYLHCYVRFNNIGTHPKLKRDIHDISQATRGNDGNVNCQTHVKQQEFMYDQFWTQHLWVTFHTVYCLVFFSRESLLFYSM